MAPLACLLQERRPPRARHRRAALPADVRPCSRAAGIAPLRRLRRRAPRRRRPTWWWSATPCRAPTSRRSRPSGWACRALSMPAGAGALLPRRPAAAGGRGHPRQDHHHRARRLGLTALRPRPRLPRSAACRIDLPAQLPRAARGERFVIEGDEYNAAYFDRGAEVPALPARDADPDQRSSTTTPTSTRRPRRCCAAYARAGRACCRRRPARRLRRHRRGARARRAPRRCRGRLLRRGAGERRPPLAAPLEATPARASASAPASARRSSSSSLGVCGRAQRWPTRSRSGRRRAATGSSRGEVAGALGALPRRQAPPGGARRRPAASTVVDDFAHHPTAVGKTLEALRQRYPRPAAGWRCFEPRSLTAGRALLLRRPTSRPSRPPTACSSRRSSTAAAWPPRSGSTSPALAADAAPQRDAGEPLRDDRRGRGAGARRGAGRRRRGHDVLGLLRRPAAPARRRRAAKPARVERGLEQPSSARARGRDGAAALLERRRAPPRGASPTISLSTPTSAPRRAASSHRARRAASELSAGSRAGSCSPAPCRALAR